MKEIKKSIGKILDHLHLKPLAVVISLSVYNFFVYCRQQIRLFYIPKLVKHRSRNGICAITLNSDWLGFGARLVLTLEFLAYCDEKGLIPIMEFGYKLRNDQTKYFDELFTNNIVPNPSIKYTTTRIDHINELRLDKDYNRVLSVELAHFLFHKYLKINQEITNEVNKFKSTILKGQIPIGVHYRGTDKVGEAPRVALQQIDDEIRNALKRIPTKSIFISSDEEAFITFIQQQEYNTAVYWREDKLRSKDGNQFHRNPQNNYTLINQEALINCLLLSQCDLLIKTASILSDCCVIFNPQIKMVILNKPHNEDLTWWPAREINQSFLVKPQTSNEQ